MTPDQKIQLLPCPFCGLKKTRIHLAEHNPANESWINCMACDATSKSCVGHAGKSAEQWAAEFWNTRAVSPDVKILREVARLASETGDNAKALSYLRIQAFAALAATEEK